MPAFAKMCAFKGSRVFSMELIQCAVGSLEFKSENKNDR